MILCGLSSIADAQLPSDGKAEASDSPVAEGASAISKPNALDGLGEFNNERRLKFHEMLEDQAQRFWMSSDCKVLKSRKTKTIGGHPKLELLDCNDDENPDKYRYMPKRGDDTQDFGFMFDLNCDGVSDYLIFYMGPVSVEMEEPIRVVWGWYHWIDSNYDGMIDILVYPGIDLAGDGVIETTTHAWLYDVDFDGKIDRGEYVVKDADKPIHIEASRRKLKLKSPMEFEIRLNSPKALEFQNQILSDLHTMSK